MKRIKPLFGEDQEIASPDEVALFEATTPEEVEAVTLSKSGGLSGAFGNPRKRKLKQIKGLKRSRSYDDPRPALASKKKRRRKKKKSDTPVLSTKKRPFGKRFVDIVKHPHDGDSDQSAHGNWARGGAKETTGAPDYTPLEDAKGKKKKQKAKVDPKSKSKPEPEEKPTTSDDPVDPKLTTANDDGKASGDGSDEAPIVTDDVDEAIALLAEGKHVELNQLDEVSTLIDKMSDFAQEAQAAGEDAPDIDLCRLTVAGTNIFCSDNVGIERINMPQFSGKARPGSKAWVAGRGTGEANVADQFVAHLQEQGIAVTEESVPASYLRASQKQLIGAKVGGIMDAMNEGKLEQTPIFVSRDNYVIDGHHRWAANVGIDFADDVAGNYEIPVIKLDVGILDALDMANEFVTDYGILPKSAPKTEDAVEKHYGPGPHKSGSPQSAHGGTHRLSGVPEVDEAIKAFLREPVGDWTTDDCPIGDLTPQQTHGACMEIAEQFATFATDRGLRAYAVNTDLDELGYKVKGKPAGGVLDEDGNIVSGRYFTHTVNEVYLPGQAWPITIDFAASQYGYPTKVLVTKHAGPGPHASGTPQSVHGSWSRGLSSGQVMEDLTDADQGFTISVPSGAKPRKGWSVALGGAESRIKMSRLTARWVAAYRAKHFDELQRSETSWGGWIYGGEAFLDVSVVTEDFREALSLARESDQIAIFNLETGEELMLDDEVRIAQLRGPAMSEEAVAKGLVIGFTPRRPATKISSMTDNPIVKHYGPGPHPGTMSPQTVHGAGSGGVTHRTQADTPQANASDEVLGITEKRQDLPRWFEGAAAPPGSYWVNDANLGDVEKKFEKMNRRATKYGLDPFTMEVTDHHEQVVSHSDMGWSGEGEMVEKWSLVKVNGTPPQFEGWQFAGRIEHLPTMESEGEDLFNILHMRPDFEGQLPEQYRDSGPNCDVCKRNVYRKDTFLVHNTETGEWKQVGRDDLKLFTGDTDPAAAEFYLRFYDDMESDDFFDARESWANAYISDTDSYLANVAAEVREHGYTSASSLKDDLGRRMEGGGATTAEIVQDPQFYVGRWGDNTPKVSDADVELATEARAFYMTYETPAAVAAYREFQREHSFDDDGFYTQSPDIYPPNADHQAGTWGWREGNAAEIYEAEVNFWKENVMGTPFDPTTGATIEHEIIDGIGVEVIHHQQSVTEKGMRDLFKLERNDSFMNNMKGAALTPFTTRSNAGLQAYIVPGYQKYIAQAAIAEARASQPVSEWVGTVGEKTHFDRLRIDSVRQGVNDYGRDWTLTKMHDQSGNLITTWYGGQMIYYTDPATEYETLWKPGDHVSGTATVKAHEVDKYSDDQKVTVVKSFLKRDTEVEIS